MGYDATSGERNTTGQPRQTQALSFAGSTAKPHKASILEELTHISRMPHILVSIRKSPLAPFMQTGSLVAFGRDPTFETAIDNSRMLRALARGPCL